MIGGKKEVARRKSKSVVRTHKNVILCTIDQYESVRKLIVMVVVGASFCC
jgi:hypothetical protein